jgi:hypothetical protein
MSLYRSILKRAWEISWKFKYLWFFGLFAALLGNGGEFEIILMMAVLAFLTVSEIQQSPISLPDRVLPISLIWR